jgi:hypothetical protein
VTSARLPPATDWGYLGAFTPSTVPLASNKALQFIFIEATSGSSLGGFYYSDGVEWIPIGNRAFSWRVVSGVADTPTLADANNGLRFTAVAGSPILTIPPASQVPWPLGTSILVMQYGVVNVTVQGGVGVNIRVNPSFLAKTAAQYSLLTVINTGIADDWAVCGDLHV